MKPQSAAFLEKSRQFLAKAQELLDSHRRTGSILVRKGRKAIVGKNSIDLAVIRQVNGIWFLTVDKFSGCIVVKPAYNRSPAVSRLMQASFKVVSIKELPS